MTIKAYFSLLALITFSFVFSQNSIFVGIAGGSGSGKTTLSNKIQEAFGSDVSIIEQDAYYKDLSYLPMHERDLVNFDHPKALDFDLLKEHLIALKEGNSIEKPTYDFKTHTRTSTTRRIDPHSVVIIDGILLFAVPEIRELFDIKIYVDNQEDIRLLRRLERDINERGRDFESVRDQYLTTVKPMHARYVEPSKWFADIIIPSAHENLVGIDLIISKLKRDVGL